MATPGQLVQVMSDVLGISKATVIPYDRVLSENGLRSKGGRGTSAAQVNSRDAANLLMALAASPIFGLSVKDAVRIASRMDHVRKSASVWSETLREFRVAHVS